MAKVHRNSVVLAAASSLAASAAVDAQAGALDASNWTGWHAGLNVSGTQHTASETDVNGWGAGGLFPLSYVTPFFTSQTTQLGIGAQVGYDWQYNNLVVGGEADASWIHAKNTFAPAGPGFFFCGPNCAVSATNELTWLATFRARAGVAFNNGLFYGTAGLALAGIDDHWGYGFSSGFIGTTTPFNNSQFKFDGVKSGFVYGGGVEYAFSRNWTGRVEALIVDFGSSSSTITGTPAFGSPGTFTTVFRDSAKIGRAALSYRW